MDDHIIFQSLIQFQKVMVKQLREERRQTRSAAIRRRKTSVQGQLSFIYNLEETDPEMTSTMALNHIHRYIKHHKIAAPERLNKKINQKIKICKVCDKWHQISSIKSCYHCEDHYHKDCLKQPAYYISGKFICPTCQNQEITSHACKVCLQSIDQETPTHTCSYCANDYHPRCMQKNNMICKRCIKIRTFLGIKETQQKKKTKQKIERNIIATNRNLRDLLTQIQPKKKALVQNSNLRIIRQGCQFKALNLLENKTKKIGFYRKQLEQTIKAKNMNYIQDLRDIEFHLLKMKEGNMDFGLQNMSKREEEEYQRYKKQPIGPFTFSFSQIKGYGVIADMNIPQNSIICEYVGEVVTLRQCSGLDELSENDSKMDLWTGRNSDQKLIIRPQKWTNIARFLNGVRNKTCDLNVRSMRLCYRGLPVVLLIANRNIKKGQSLVYDYNAGGISAKFDTSNFK